jgi:hypothetical protein
MVFPLTVTEELIVQATVDAPDEQSFRGCSDGSVFGAAEGEIGPIEEDFRAEDVEVSVVCSDEGRQKIIRRIDDGGREGWCAGKSEDQRDQDRESGAIGGNGVY